MAALEDKWKQVTDSDRYQTLDAGDKETVRRNFYRKFVVNSAPYQAMEQDKRMAIRKEFDRRTMVQEPSMMDTIKGVAGPALEAAGAGAMEGLKESGREVAAAAQAPEKIMPSKETITSSVPYIAPAIEQITGKDSVIGGVMNTPLKVPFTKKDLSLKRVAEGLHKVGEFVSEPGRIAPSDQEIESEAKAKGGMNHLSNFDVARIEAGGFASIPWEMASQAIPETVGSAVGYVALDKFLELAGTTFLGKPISELMGKTKPKVSPELESSAFKKAIMKANLELKGRETLDGPPRPLEDIARKEEMMRLQSWLEDRAHGPEPQGDLHPSPKVNQSQIDEHMNDVREGVQKRLEALKNEPRRFDTLAYEEDALKGYYRDKLGNMVILAGPGEPLPKVPMLPAPPERPLLQAPKEVPSRAVPREAAPAALEIKVNAQNLKDYLVDRLSKQYPKESRQTIDSMAGVMRKNMVEHVGGESPVLKQIADTLIEQGHADHLKAEEFHRTVPKYEKGEAFLTRQEISRLKEQGISKDDVVGEAKRLKAEWDFRNGEPEGIKHLREQIGGIAPMNPDPSTGQVPLSEEYNLHVKKSLRGKVPMDQAAEEMYSQGFTQGPSTSDLLKFLADNEAMSGKPRSVKSFISEAIHNLEAPLTPPDDFSLESVKGRAYEPVEENPDITQKSMFDLGKDVGEYWSNKFKGEGGGYTGRPTDPVELARMEESMKEMVRRARQIGYDTTEDIMLYVARNAPKEYMEYFAGQLKAKQVSPWDTHVYKEMDAAEKGNQIAKKSITDAAWYRYFTDRFSKLKEGRERRDLSRPLARFKDGDEQKLRLEFLFFKNDVLRESKIPKIEREALRFYMEGQSPALEKLKVFRPNDAEKILALAKNPTPQMVETAKQIRPYEDEWWRLFNEYYDDVAYVKDYAMRRWKKGEDFVSWQNRSTGGKAPWLKHRRLTSAAEGINAGFEPISFDIRDDLQAESDLRTGLLSKLHTLRKVAMSMDDNMNPSLVLDESQPKIPGTVGSPKKHITPFAMKAPEGYLTSDHPLLRGLAFNPKYKPLMDYMFTQRFRWAPIQMAEQLNALSKRSIFLYSMFHPWALTEMLLAGSSMRDMFVLNREKNVLYKTISGISRAATENLPDQIPWKEPIKAARTFYNSFMEGHAALAKRPLALDSAEHSLTFNAISDVQSDAFNKLLTKMEGWLQAHSAGPAAKGLKVVRGANEIFDKALWDYWSPMIKMNLYESHLADNMKAFPNMPVDALKIQTATYINKAVGGMAWGDLLASPQTQQALQWLMLAPDWTIGRVLMGASALTAGPQGRQARKLLARGFVTWFVFGNMMNYINSQKYGLQDRNGKVGRFMWDNDPGRESDVIWGKEGGRTVYVTPSKAFTELYDDIFYPKKTARGKVSPVVNMAAGAVTGYGANGYPIKGPLDLAGRMSVPMSARGGNVYATLPKHKGMNAYEAEQLFEDYERTGNKKSYEKAMFFSDENGLNWQGLHQHAKSVVKSERRRDLRRQEAGSIFR